MQSRWLVILLMLVLSNCAGHHVPTPLARIAKASVPSFEHVFVVVEENENYGEVIGNTKDMPYLNALASNYGLATNYYANTHPSINNYFFLTAGRSGTTRPWIRDLSDEYPREVGGENIASVLSANGKTWKSYAEDIPHRAYIGDDHFPYVKRHNPFAYFTSVRHKSAPGEPSQRDNIVRFEELERDLERDSLPNYSFIVPNLFHDGHDDSVTRDMAPCGDHRALQEVDTWLKKKMGPLIASATFQRSGLLIIVFDEACEQGRKADWTFDPKKPGIRGGGHVAAVLVSPRIPSGTKSDVLYHHESVLRLSLRTLGIEDLPGAAASSPDMNDFFPQKR